MGTPAIDTTQGDSDVVPIAIIAIVDGEGNPSDDLGLLLGIGV